MTKNSGKPTQPFFQSLQAFADGLAARFAVQASFNPEDQLKSPIDMLLKSAASSFGFQVEVITEVQEKVVAGRPDMGVARKGLLVGYVELKAPGKGADPTRLKGADKAQWDRFKDLPNLIYTDGNDWALYRGGERVSKIVRLSGDVISHGASVIAAGDDEALLGLLRDFFNWNPIVPNSPRVLAELLAPLCRLLRTEVAEALKNSVSNLSSLAVDWRKYLFPDEDDVQFADAYAQTLTYALLLARLSGGCVFTSDEAVRAIRKEHRLLSESLKLLADNAAREEIKVPVELLERVIAGVDVAALARKSGGDPWLYFYEDFLAAYDPKMRKDRGVYYTPVPVVHAQVRLVAELLQTHFGARYSFVDERVVTLDPAAGTGTYIIAALTHGLNQVEADKGKGLRVHAATTGARNIHAFEVLVGPYAVAHLRLTQQIVAEGGEIPADGTHVYLTDTLEPPHATPPGHLPMAYRSLGEEHERAQKIKAETPILVCIGNPPYDRQTLNDEERANKQATRKGGWIRYGDERKEGTGILQDFITPLAALNAGLHAKNLYNDYVYFWRWALWKVFESKNGPGIVSFITASSYLQGPGFAGMRQLMRQTFDELWIIDLEGGNLGARKTENVFAIQTPVVIAIGARYAAPNPSQTANVHYARLTGSQEEKFARLDAIEQFASLKWKTCPNDWYLPFLPVSDAPYFDWPLLTDLFPWQESGVQFKRSWPIGETRDVLEARWRALLIAPDKKIAFKETARTIEGKVNDWRNEARKLMPLNQLKPDTVIPDCSHYSYRSFDRRYAILDSRLADRHRPDLLRSHGCSQVYLTSLLTEVLGQGPAATATSLIPDLHHFRGSFGGKHVIPLWRDPEAAQANVTKGVLDNLTSLYGHAVTPEDLFAYAYVVLASPAYVKMFWDELTIPGPRLPMTKDAEQFAAGVAYGKQLIWLHTYCERFMPQNSKFGHILPGKARCKHGTLGDMARYPNVFSYDPAKSELYIGEGAQRGVFGNVSKEVWEFSISGFEVVKSWLGYRMKERKGKSSSPLDKIRPEHWVFDEELLNLLWILEHTLAIYPAVEHWLSQIAAGALLSATDFPAPAPAERQRLPARVIERETQDMF